MGPGDLALRDGDRGFRLVWPGFDLAPGQALALTGPSGSGKTLLLEVLGLLRRPDPGLVYRWDGGGGEGGDLAGLWARGPRDPALARARGRLFGFVPQSGGLLPFLTVAENVALPQRITGRPDSAHVGMLIDRLGLGPVAGLRPAALSIGQRQRVAVARALAHRPPFVIADEPTGALDPASADGVLALLLEVAAGQGGAVILSSHDLDRLGRFGIARMVLSVGAGSGGEVVSRLAAGIRTEAGAVERAEPGASPRTPGVFPARGRGGC
jgi:putative ABC transport system ATP-binding protein